MICRKLSEYFTPKEPREIRYIDIPDYDATKKEEPMNKQTRYDKLVDKIVDSPDKKPLPAGHEWVGVIIHHTGIGDRDPDTVSPSKWKELWNGITGWLSKADNVYVSAHFHIGRQGEIAMLVDPKTHISYHAGVSSWFHPKLRKQVNSWNTYAVGIEVLGDGNKGAYSEEQYVACAKLTKALYEEFSSIDPRCITGHENIAPGRKTDPGRYFNWRKFFDLLYS